MRNILLTAAIIGALLLACVMSSALLCAASDNSAQVITARAAAEVTLQNARTLQIANDALAAQLRTLRGLQFAIALIALTASIATGAIAWRYLQLQAQHDELLTQLVQRALVARKEVKQ